MDEGKRERMIPLHFWANAKYFITFTRECGLSIRPIRKHACEPKVSPRRRCATAQTQVARAAPHHFHDDACIDMYGARLQNGAR
ncbi:hypothetical protein [Rhizobium sp. TRM95796]|uniref:hypothetical protein n=1 Tax=Rhizobium sp. TRM95796 TaxID=2979862 RepID=UPI0021E909FE|nr:hypothetical protein [Rhizobium sp. TRM95796]MCV3767088.1 hypothetical protein [Rhizobium sp. TRM95796]